MKRKLPGFWIYPQYYGGDDRGSLWPLFARALVSPMAISIYLMIAVCTAITLDWPINFAGWASP